MNSDKKYVNINMNIKPDIHINILVYMNTVEYRFLEVSKEIV